MFCYNCAQISTNIYSISQSAAQQNYLHAYDQKRKCELVGRSVFGRSFDANVVSASGMARSEVNGGGARCMSASGAAVKVSHISKPGVE
jgi:hypothetical protein